MEYDVQAKQKVTFHAVFPADTKIFIDDELVPLKTIYTFYKDSYKKTLGLDLAELQAMEITISDIPFETYSKDFAIVEFSSGFKLRCAPCTPILTLGGYKQVPELVPGVDKAIGLVCYNKGTGNSAITTEMVVFDILSCHNKPSLMDEPVYGILLGEHQNIFLPYYDAKNETMTFINVFQ